MNLTREVKSPVAIPQEAPGMSQHDEGAESPRPTAGPGSVRRRALVRAFVFVGILALATQMRVEAGEARILGHSGPECLIGEQFGDAACPTCGLTRSVSLAVQGDWGSAVGFHGAGPVIAVLLALGVLVESTVFLRSERLEVHRRLGRSARWVLLLGVALGWLGKGLG